MSNPKGTEPTILKIPTLGHAVCLGELYDQRTGNFLGVQLYPEGNIQEKETDIRHTELSLSLATSMEDKASLIDVNAKLSLEIACGLVKVSGSASYLNDSKSNTNEQAFALALKMRLNEKRILFAEEELGRNVLEVAQEDYIATGKATHFVSAIVYGGNFIVNLVAKKSKLSKEEKVEGKLKAEFSHLKGAIKLEGEVDAKIKAEFESMNDHFNLIVHGDVALEKVPINPQDVLDTFPDAASLITAGGGVPISVTLQPIPEMLIKGCLVYEIDADRVERVLEAFSLLDDLRSRFSVLTGRVKPYQYFIPELERAIRLASSQFGREHGKLLHQLRQFLYDYQHGKAPDSDIGGDVLKAAHGLYNDHLDPTKQSDPPGQYPVSLVGLETEYSTFRYLVSDIQRVRESLEPPSTKNPAQKAPKETKQSSIYLSSIEDVCRAARVQRKIPLFTMIPLAPASDEVKADLAVIQFLALIRNYGAYFKNVLNPAYIVYAEVLERLERRLPNDGKFSELKHPSLFIGQVDVQGKLTWSNPPPLSSPPTSEEVQTRLSSEYPNPIVSRAMFFQSGSEPTFRFVTNRGWEFSVGAWVGPDLQGTFYYKDGVFGGKLPDGQVAEALFEVLRVESKNNEPFAHIKFYVPNSTTELLGEFLARDLNDTTGCSGFLNKSSIPGGKWMKGNPVETNATASKAADSDNITIVCNALGLKIEVTCESDDDIYEEAINNTKGKLTYKTLKELRSGKDVRWHHDHVVFQNGLDTTDFTAFVPFKDSPPNPLGTDRNEKRWSGVQYVNT
ncbi:hypothetical protein EV363DRAFT_146977 [Boletus edulis]|nr:hypothetical protein EV363DRAFT_146977 [Boletus edulis]